MIPAPKQVPSPLAEDWATRGISYAVGADVGVADVLAAREIGPGLPQSASSRRIRSLDLAPLTGCTNRRGLKDSFAIAYRRAVK